MAEPESTDNGIERPVRERQTFDIAFGEFDFWMKPSCQLDHPWREIDAGGQRAAACRCGGKTTRPTRYVEQPDAGTGVDGIEERLGGQCGNGREKFLVTCRQSIMSLAFECTQPLRVTVRQVCCGHGHAPSRRYHNSRALRRITSIEPPAIC